MKGGEDVLIIDRVVGFTPENLPFVMIAVGIEEVDDIIQDGEVFKAYNADDELLIELKEYYAVTVTYKKESK